MCGNLFYELTKHIPLIIHEDLGKGHMGWWDTLAVPCIYLCCFPFFSSSFFSLSKMCAERSGASFSVIIENELSVNPGNGFLSLLKGGGSVMVFFFIFIFSSPCLSIVCLSSALPCCYL